MGRVVKDEGGQVANWRVAIGRVVKVATSIYHTLSISISYLFYTSKLIGNNPRCID